MMFILSSPSGAGKTTVANALLKADSNLELSISVTTRPKRHTESEGKDYFFVSDDEFREMKRKDLLLESAEVFGYQYGTPLQQTMGLLASGKDVLYDIDWQGAKQIALHYPELVVKVFILPPSMKVLEERLRRRASDDEQTISRRLEGSLEEIAKCGEYDYIVVNNNIEDTVNKVLACLHAERLKRSRLELKDFTKTFF